MSRMTIDQAMDAALGLHQAGRLAEAEGIYREVLAREPARAEALHLLGMALAQAGRPEEGLQLLNRAIEILPHDSMYLGNRAYVLLALKRPEEALRDAEKALAIQPGNVSAMINMGKALGELFRHEESIACYERVLAREPGRTEAINNLGNSLGALGRTEEAVQAYERGIKLDPGQADLWNNYGNVLKGLGRRGEAEAAYREAWRLRPTFTWAANNLGVVLMEMERFDEASAALDAARKLDPNLADVPNNLGNVAKEQGRADDGIELYKEAVRLKSDFAQAHDNLVYTMSFSPTYGAEAILDACRRWDAAHARAVEGQARGHGNSANPGRALRIGFVSPDFRDHCQALFTLPLLRNIDRSRYRVICYSDVTRADHVTERLMGMVDGWRSLLGKNDEAVVAMIRADQIDILVDLTMHMARNRLLVFARKPAPVQVSWLAYPGTTGLRAMDYRISDVYLDPPGENGDAAYAEETVRLPETFWCYDPNAMVESPGVNGLPMEASGSVTFGCLNSFSKTNEGVFSAWAEILGQVAGSQLHVLCGSGSPRRATIAFFSGQGIDPRRVVFFNRMPRADYMARYHAIDVGLDPFPYGGHTTSLDALWMGVPVVTLVGQTVVGRAGLCQMMNLGMPELIATSVEEYVAKAVALARDAERVKEYRRTLRGRMEKSALMDGARFARNMEGAFREMWRRWCAGQAAGNAGRA